MSHRQKLAMIFTMLLGGFFGLLNETLLTTALPRIMKDFNIEYSQVQWLTTAFLLTNGVVIPLSAFIIQRYSTRQVFLTGILIFFIGTMLGGFSPNFTIFNRTYYTSFRLRYNDATDDDNHSRCLSTA